MISQDVGVGREISGKESKKSPTSVSSGHIYRIPPGAQGKDKEFVKAYIT